MSGIYMTDIIADRFMIGSFKVENRKLDKRQEKFASGRISNCTDQKYNPGRPKSIPETW